MKVIEPPKIEPVSLAEVKDQLGITDTRSDGILSRRIVEARELVEQYTGRALLSQTREIRWDCFVDRHELPSALTVSSVKYIDTNGVEQTVSSSDYTLDTYAFIPFVQTAYDVAWPYTRHEKNAVRIQFTAGYGTTVESVPALIREQIILLIGHWTNRQPQLENGITVSRIPYAIRDMLDNYRYEFI
jgi:uncharacterized phiE125 gp8 family phage protein